MKRTVLALIIIGLVVSSCGNSSVEVKDQVQEEVFDTAAFIQKVEDIDSKLATSSPSKKDLITAIGLFEDYALMYPGTEKSADYLLKASDFCLAIDRVEKSVFLLSRIIDQNPDYSRLEAVYFNRANHTDLNLRDTSLAKTYYKEFIEKFPDSKLVNDAKIRIETVSLSLEEMVERFEEMNDVN